MAEEDNMKGGKSEGGKGRTNALNMESSRKRQLSGDEEQTSAPKASKEKRRSHDRELGLLQLIQSRQEEHVAVQVWKQANETLMNARWRVQIAEHDVVLCSEYLSVVTESLVARRAEETGATTRLQLARAFRESRQRQLRSRRRDAARARARRRTAKAVVREMSSGSSMEAQMPPRDAGEVSTLVMDYSNGEASNRIKGIAARDIHDSSRLATIQDRNAEVSRADARLSAAQQSVRSAEQALSSGEQRLQQAMARQQVAREEVERMAGVVEREDNNIEPLRQTVIDAMVEEFECSVVERAAHRGKEQAEMVAIEAQCAFEDEFEMSGD